MRRLLGKRARPSTAWVIINENGWYLRKKLLIAWIYESEDNIPLLHNFLSHSCVNDVIIRENVQMNPRKKGLSMLSSD